MTPVTSLYLFQTSRTRFFQYVVVPPSVSNIDPRYLNVVTFLISSPPSLNLSSHEDGDRYSVLFLLTHLHYTKTSEFSYSDKPDFPCGCCGSQFETWPPCHHISESKRRRAFIVDSIYIGFQGRSFQNRYCRIHRAIAPAIYEAI